MEPWIECSLNVAREVWVVAESALNSTFSVALIGSAAGAFGGGWAAQRVIQRSDRKRRYIQEIRNINSGIALSVAILNVMLPLKSKHVLPLYNQLQKARSARDNGSAPKLDLLRLSAPTLPIDSLKNSVFHGIPSHLRLLRAVSTLESCYEELRQALAHRNNILASWKNGKRPPEEIVPLVLGLPTSSGQTDREYPDVMEVVRNHVNNVLFFSSLICRDLMGLGGELKRREKAFAKEGPEVAYADLTKTNVAELIPPNSAYSDWQKGFVD